jgi:hypothetical protein
MDDFNAVWEKTLDQLSLQMAQLTFDTWLRDTRAVGFEDGALVVAVKNEYAPEWLSRLEATIERTAARVAGQVVGVRFVVGTNGDGDEGSIDDLELGEEEEEQASASEPGGPRAFVVPEFDVHTAGWFPVSEYECRFWAPFLGRIEWRVWEIVRKQDKRRKKTEWTPVQRWTAPALAEQVPCGRQALVGVRRRDEDGELHYRPGAFKRLMRRGIATVERRGQHRCTTYWISVKTSLGLLRPDQVAQLAARLQVQHDRWLVDHGFDPQEWDYVG